MRPNYKLRRLVVLLIIAIISLSLLAYDMATRQTMTPVQSEPPAPAISSGDAATPDASQVLATLSIKGKAPKTGYQRTQFSNGWARIGACDLRNIILRRDLINPQVDDACKVTSGQLNDPYTGRALTFMRGPGTSDAVQIDHVVALSNAWQTGAQQLTVDQRHALANDPLNLLAVDGKANQQKSDADAATWLPPNKPFRCQYVARQIAVKQAYQLWVVPAEAAAMQQVLANCPGQLLPIK